MSEAGTTIKKNFFYNSLLLVFNTLYPLLIFPYVSRVLGPENLGKANFAFSLVMNIYSFACIVNAVYAIRELGKNRDNPEETSKLFSEFAILSFVPVFILTLFYFSSIFFVDKLRADPALFIVVGFQLLLTGFSIDWFYQGIENYRFISVRNIVFKLLSLALTYLAVHESRDYIIYAAITVVAFCGSNIVNVLGTRKYTRFRLKGLNFKRHIKPMVIFYFISVFSGLSVNFDQILVGFSLGDKAVGFYSTAVKILGLFVSIVASLPSVLLSRASYYFANNMKDELTRILDKAFKFNLFLTLPITVGIFFLSKDLIDIIAGAEFAPAVPVLFVVSFALLFKGSAFIVGLENYTAGRELLYALSLVVGVAVEVALILFLMPSLSLLGVAIAFVASNFVIVAIQAASGWKLLSTIVLSPANLKYLVAALAMGGVIYLVFPYFAEMHLILRLLLTAGIGAAVYCVLLFIMRDKILLYGIDWGLKKLKIVH